MSAALVASSRFFVGRACVCCGCGVVGVSGRDALQPSLRHKEGIRGGVGDAPGLCERLDNLEVAAVD